MTAMNSAWPKVLRWFHYPAVNPPKMVDKLNGGACYNFQTREILVEEPYVRKTVASSGITEEQCLEGLLSHEVGHYMVFPRTLGTWVLAAKMTDDFFSKKSNELTSFILQTYADMCNDTSSVLEEQRTEAIMRMRLATQLGYDDPLNRNVRSVMLAYLHKQANRQYALEPELEQYLERMMQIDFLNQDTIKMRLGIWSFGNIILDMVEKYGEADEGAGTTGKPSPGKGTGSKLKISEPGDCDIKTVLGEATESDIRQALREVAGKVSKGEFETVKKWLESQGAKPSESEVKIFGIGTSEGELRVDPDVVDYYKLLATHYPLVITKKPMPTETTIRAFSQTERWRLGTDPLLVLPHSSGGHILPGVTRNIRITERPIKTRDYATPHLLVIVDSSGSMPNPSQQKSYSVLGGFCAANSYHVNGSHVGVINFSGSSFYLPYTRNLDESLAAISAYQGGGTVVDLDLLEKMLGPEMARLYRDTSDKNLHGHLPQSVMRKELEISMAAMREAFSAESIDVMMFTDGGIYNLDAVLTFLSGRAELNRATIILSHSFPQELGNITDPRIRVVPVEKEQDLKNIPSLSIRGVRDHFSAFAEVKD